RRERAARLETIRQRVAFGAVAAGLDEGGEVGGHGPAFDVALEFTDGEIKDVYGPVELAGSGESVAHGAHDAADAAENPGAVEAQVFAVADAAGGEVQKPARDGAADRLAGEERAGGVGPRMFSRRVLAGGSRKNRIEHRR